MKTRLAVFLKRALDKAKPVNPPGYDKTEAYAKDFTPVLNALKQAGYELEAHQGGISGTLLVAVKTNH